MMQQGDACDFPFLTYVPAMFAGQEIGTDSCESDPIRSRSDSVTKGMERAGANPSAAPFQFVQKVEIRAKKCRLPI